MANSRNQYRCKECKKIFLDDRPKRCTDRGYDGVFDFKASKGYKRAQKIWSSIGCFGAILGIGTYFFASIVGFGFEEAKMGENWFLKGLISLIAIFVGAFLIFVLQVAVNWLFR